MNVQCNYFISTWYLIAWKVSFSVPWTGAPAVRASRPATTRAPWMAGCASRASPARHVGDGVACKSRLFGSKVLDRYHCSLVSVISILHNCTRRNSGCKTIFQLCKQGFASLRCPFHLGRSCEKECAGSIDCAGFHMHVTGDRCKFMRMPEAFNPNFFCTDCKVAWNSERALAVTRRQCARLLIRTLFATKFFAHTFSKTKLVSISATQAGFGGRSSRPTRRARRSTSVRTSSWS